MPGVGFVAKRRRGYSRPIERPTRRSWGAFRYNSICQFFAAHRTSFATALSMVGRLNSVSRPDNSRVGIDTQYSPGRARPVGCLACGDVRGSTGESWSFAGADTSVATMAVATGTALGI